MVKWRMTLACVRVQPFYFASRRPLILGVVFLGLTREFLFTNRVHDHNTFDELYTPSSCSDAELKWRTYDGTCNNREKPGNSLSETRHHRFHGVSSHLRQCTAAIC